MTPIRMLLAVGLLMAFIMAIGFTAAIQANPHDRAPATATAAAMPSTNLFSEIVISGTIGSPPAIRIQQTKIERSNTSYKGEPAPVPEVVPLS